MSLTVTCPACGKGLRAQDDQQGQRVKCPACGHALTVPGRSAGPRSGARSAARRRAAPAFWATPLPWMVASGAVLVLAVVFAVVVLLNRPAEPEGTEAPAQAENTWGRPPRPATTPGQSENPGGAEKPAPETKPEPRPIEEPKGKEVVREKTSEPEKPAPEPPPPLEPDPAPILPLLAGHTVVKYQVSSRPGAAGGINAARAMLDLINQPAQRGVNASLGILRAHAAEIEPEALLFLGRPLPFAQVRQAAGEAPATAEEAYYGLAAQPFGRQDLTLSARPGPGLQRLRWHRYRWLSLGVVADSVHVLRVELPEARKGRVVSGPRPKGPAREPVKATGPPLQGLARFLPEDTQVLVRVDPGAVLGSAVVRDRAGALRATLESPALKAAQAGLGIDLARDVSEVVVAGSGLTEGGGLIAVRATHDPARLRTYAESAWERLPQAGDKGHVVYKIAVPGGRPLFVAPVGTGDLILADLTEEGLRAALRRGTGSPPGADGVRTLWELTEGPDQRGAAVRLAALGTVSAAGGATLKDQAGIDSLAAGLFLDRDLRAVAGLRVADRQAARDLAAKVNAGLAKMQALLGDLVRAQPDLAALAPALRSLRATAGERAVTVEGRMTGADLGRLLASPALPKLLQGGR